MHIFGGFRDGWDSVKIGWLKTEWGGGIGTKYIVVERLECQRWG